MNAFILTDRGFCFLQDGAPRWLSMDEFTESGLARQGDAAIFLGGVEFRSIQASGMKAPSGGIFPDKFIIRQERLKGGMCLAMGAREGMLRTLYDLFPRGSVKACVPYALAIRSFLLVRGMPLDGRAHLVVDDAGERVFLTILDGMSVLETRELVFQDAGRLVEEVKRSEKYCLERLGLRAQVRLVSNHRSFVERLSQERPDEDIVVIEELLPVLGVVHKARFGIHFPSPAQDAAMARQEKWRRSIFQYAVPAGLCAGAVLFAFIMSHGVAKAVHRVTALEQEVREREERLKKISVRTYQDRLRSLKQIPWEVSFVDLLGSFPRGWQLQEIVWSCGLNGREEVSALILKGEMSSFEGQGVFKKVRIVNEIVSGRPAVRVVVSRGAMSEGKDNNEEHF